VPTLSVDGVHVNVTHLERVFWPAADGCPAITKGELLDYLARVAPFLLPHCRDRPITLDRYPTGLAGRHWFQKHVETPLPPFVERECLFAEQHQSSGDHIIVNNLATLIWLGQMANLELHTWYSRTNPEPDARALPRTFSGSVEALEASVLNYPDFMVFDLDPYLYAGHEPRGGQPAPHREGYARTCEAAHWLREVLDELRLPSFVKTSGKTGLHVFVPILRQFDYDAVRAMAEQICRFLHARHPDATTMEWSVERRAGKIFLDHNQNTRGKTLACAYSPRALPGAPVSMPVHWDEIERVYPSDFTFESVLARLQRDGDLWSDILLHKADLATALNRAP
jgi:bifunctional non-homologous end joining protein LigD